MQLQRPSTFFFSLFLKKMRSAIHNVTRVALITVGEIAILTSQDSVQGIAGAEWIHAIATCSGMEVDF